MNWFLLGCLLGIIVGFLIGGFVVHKFNPKDITYAINKLRAKKGGVIDIQQEIQQPEAKQKRKLFKFKNRKK